MFKIRIVTAAAAFSLFLGALFLFCGDSGPQKEPDAAKKDLSVLSFSLPDLNGQAKTLSAFKKKLIIVDFWTTWCPPCRESIPHLNAFYTGHRDRVDVIGISLDTVSPADVAAFARSMNIEYPVLTGGRELAVAYGITSIPTIFVVDGSGKILRRHVGMADSRTLDGLLKGL